MPCYKPLKGYRSKKVNKATGKRPIVFRPHEGFVDQPVVVPCGQCIGCKLEKSRQWAIRAVHEASLHEKNCFITLTYNNENLPKDKSINKEHPVLFMKRLREKYGKEIRSFGCGEYGEDFGRPHYHICLFNHDFNDKTTWKKTEEQTLWRSESLEKLWGKGFCTIGTLTFESAAYVARYVTKKVTGAKEKTGHYEWTDEKGEIHTRQPERALCISRNPGLGKGWLEKWKPDAFPNDLIVLRGKKMKPPKYYDYLHEKQTTYKKFHPVNEKIMNNSDEMDAIKRARKRKIEEHLEKNPDPRHDVREEVQELKAKQLKRSLENEK